MTRPSRAVEERPVQRVGDDADELPRRIARQAGVGVEGDAVAHAGEDAGVTRLDGEARVRRPAQQPVELLELAALALPAHPDAFARVPLPDPVEEVEAVVPALRVARVEGLDSGTRGGQDGRVVRHLALRGVGEVAEDREVDVRVQVAQGEHLEVLEQLVHLGRRW